MPIGKKRGRPRDEVRAKARRQLAKKFADQHWSERTFDRCWRAWTVLGEHAFWRAVGLVTRPSGRVNVRPLEILARYEQTMRALAAVIGHAEAQAVADRYRTPRGLMVAPFEREARRIIGASEKQQARPT